MTINVTELLEWLAMQQYDLDEHPEEYARGWAGAMAHVSTELPRFVSGIQARLPPVCIEPGIRNLDAGPRPEEAGTTPIERGLAELCDAVAIKGGRPDYVAIPFENVQMALDAGLDVSFITEAGEQFVIDDPDATTPRQRFDLSESK